MILSGVKPTPSTLTANILHLGSERIAHNSKNLVIGILLVPYHIKGSGPAWYI